MANLLCRSSGTTPISKRRFRSAKATLGTTRGISGHSWSNSRICTHNLSHAKTQISEKFLERLLQWGGGQTATQILGAFFLLVWFPHARLTISGQFVPLNLSQGQVPFTPHIHVVHCRRPPAQHVCVCCIFPLPPCLNGTSQRYVAYKWEAHS